MIVQDIEELVVDFVKSFKIGIPAIELINWLSKRVPNGVAPSIFFAIDSCVKSGKLKKLMFFDPRLSNTLIVFLTASDLSILEPANDS